MNSSLDHKRFGLHFVCTCISAPEQHDVYRDSELVGYVRRGHFAVTYPDMGSIDLHDGTNDGFGGFTDAERNACLDLAASLILQELGKA